MKQDSSILKEDSRRKKINEYQIKFNVLVKKNNQAWFENVDLNVN